MEDLAWLIKTIFVKYICYSCQNMETLFGMQSAHVYVRQKVFVVVPLGGFKARVAAQKTHDDFIMLLAVSLGCRLHIRAAD